jgi:aminoglycoside phosphotransferase (APT) family kinase protein
MAVTGTRSISLGEVVARGSRSTVHSYGRGAVVKVPDPSTPESWIRYEARYAEAARIAGAPVPRLLGMEEVAGRTASVWEHVEGMSMWQHVVDRPDRSAELGRLLAELQLALFELVPAVALPRQRDRLTSKIRWAAASIDESLVQALELLPPDSAALHLCHGDLHPSNVLLGPEGPMIVDWFDASRGDPVADVARSSLVLLSDGTDPPRHLPGSDGGTLGAMTDAYLARLSEGLDIDQNLLRRWQAVNAVARMAEGVPRVTLEQVWMRFVGAGNGHAAAN